MERKISKVIKKYYVIFYNINLVYLVKSLSKILEFFVFLIIGRNKPKMYNNIITSETINIARTAFIFIKLFFFQSWKQFNKITGFMINIKLIL